MVRKESKAIGRICTFLMILMVVVIGSTLAILAIAAFWSLESAGEKITKCVCDTVNELKILGPTKEAKEFLDGAITRLKAISSECLQANTIAFLFQVFSIGLLSAGGYLVLDMKKRLSESAKLIARIPKLLAEDILNMGAAGVCMSLGGQALMAGEAMRRSADVGDIMAFGHYSVLALESMDDLRERLRNMDKRKQEIDKGHRDILVDQVGHILNGLKDFPEEYKDRVQGIREVVIECRDMLRDYRWIIDYEELAKKYMRGGKLELKVEV